MLFREAFLVTFFVNIRKENKMLRKHPYYFINSSSVPPILELGGLIFLLSFKKIIWLIKKSMQTHHQIIVLELMYAKAREMHSDTKCWFWKKKSFNTESCEKHFKVNIVRALRQRAWILLLYLFLYVCKRIEL